VGNSRDVKNNNVEELYYYNKTFLVYKFALLIKTFI